MEVHSAVNRKIVGSNPTCAANSKHLHTYMDAEIRKLKKLTKFMKKEGITSLKTADIELSIDPKFMFPVEQSTSQPTTDEIKEEPTYTDEEILMWSAPGLSNEGMQ